MVAPMALPSLRAYACHARLPTPLALLLPQFCCHACLAQHHLRGGFMWTNCPLPFFFGDVIYPVLTAVLLRAGSCAACHRPYWFGWVTCYYCLLIPYLTRCVRQFCRALPTWLPYFSPFHAALRFLRMPWLRFTALLMGPSLLQRLRRHPSAVRLFLPI